MRTEDGREQISSCYFRTSLNISHNMMENSAMCNCMARSHENKYDPEAC